MKTPWKQALEKGRKLEFSAHTYYPSNDDIIMGFVEAAVKDPGMKYFRDVHKVDLASVAEVLYVIDPSVTGVYL